MTATLTLILVLAGLPPQQPALPTLLLPSGEQAWVVRIETSGGFTGRGAGSYTASSAGELKCLSFTLQPACPERLAADVQVSLSRLVAAVSSNSAGRPAVVSPGGTSICNDCVTTTMTLRQRDGGAERVLTYRWDDSTVAALSADVQRLHDAVIALASLRAR